MKMTSEFTGSATRQLETRYYHAYENGACYEYVLGLATSGFGQEGVQAIDRDEVFGRLERIMATVKIRPVSEEQVAQKQDVTEGRDSKAGGAEAVVRKTGTRQSDGRTGSRRSRPGKVTSKNSPMRLAHTSRRLRCVGFFWLITESSFSS